LVEISKEKFMKSIVAVVAVVALSALTSDVWAEGGASIHSLANLEAVKQYVLDSDKARSKAGQCLASKADPSSDIECWSAATATDLVSLPTDVRQYVLDTDKFAAATTSCKAKSTNDVCEDQQCVAAHRADAFNLSHPDGATITIERNKEAMGRPVQLMLLLQQQQLCRVQALQSRRGNIDAARRREIALLGQAENPALQALINASNP
jgi:hypothetical protein